MELQTTPDAALPADTDPALGEDPAAQGVSEFERQVRGSHAMLMSFVDSPNVAMLLEQQPDGVSELSKLGARVVREYEIDETSRAEWKKRTKAAMDLALQVQQSKTFPWPNAANVKYPLMTVAAIQFAARAYPAIVSGRDVVKGVVVGSDAGQEQVDPQTGQPAMVGAGLKRARADRVATHMSWQLTDQMEEWEEETDKLLHQLPIVGCAFRKAYFDRTLARNCSHLVSAMDCVVNYWAKSIDTAPRVTHLLKLYPYQITERIRTGVFRDVPLGMAENGSEDDEAPHEFLEQHRLWDLDRDGYPEPYVVTVHKETQQVVRIVARFDADGVMMNARGQVARIVPIQYWVKYPFIPAPDGSFYDVGFGMLLNPINEAVNTVLNQLLDAGTLANTGGGFIGKGLRMKGGPLRFSPGEWKPVDGAGAAIKDNLVPLPIREPSAVLFQLLGLLIEAGKEIASVKDVLSGDSRGSSTMPATTTLALIEQGMKTFTAIFKRIHRALKRELSLLYQLNARYMEEEEYFTVLDTPQAVAREDYALGGMDIVPVSDPTSVSDMQKLVRAEFLKGFIGMPGVNAEEILKRVFAAANIEEPEKILTPPPDPQQVAQEVMGGLEARESQAKAAKDMAQAEKTATETEMLRMQMAGMASRLDQIMAALQGMTPNGPTGPGTLAGMDAGPGDAGVPPVSEGLPAFSAGGVGEGQPVPGGMGGGPGAMPAP